MIHSVPLPPATGIRVHARELPPAITVTAYCRRAEARGFRVVQYREQTWLVRVQ